MVHDQNHRDARTSNILGDPPQISGHFLQKKVQTSHVRLLGWLSLRATPADGLKSWGAQWEPSGSGSPGAWWFLVLFWWLFQWENAAGPWNSHVFFLENNRIDHEILEPVLKTKPNDEVGDENAGVYQRTLVGCNHPKHGYNQQVYLIKMISWDDLMMRSRIVGFIPICWRCVVSTIEASDPWATGARVFVPSFFFRPRCEWISPKGTTIGFFPAKTDGKHQGPLLHGGTNIFLGINLELVVSISWWNGTVSIFIIQRFINPELTSSVYPGWFKRKGTTITSELSWNIEVWFAGWLRQPSRTYCGWLRNPAPVDRW